NVKVVLEGEEECGGHLFETLLRNPEYTGWFTNNVALICDTEMKGRDEPAITGNVRGILYLEISAKGPKQSLHSGQLGGILVNPANYLASLVSRLVDVNSGRVLVPGFYDNIAPLPSRVLELLPSSAEPLAALAEETGVSEFFVSDPVELAKRRYFGPTC